MSKFASVLHRLEIECWILGVQMSSYWVSSIVMEGCAPSQPSFDPGVTIH